MKFLILNSDYSEFLRWLYAQHPGLEKQPYGTQMQARMDSLFGVADFYSGNLRKLGHGAWDIHTNNEFMQKAWIRANRLEIKKSPKLGKEGGNILQRGIAIAARTPLRYLKPLIPARLMPINIQPSWFYPILSAQIRHYKLDVLLNQWMEGINVRFLQEIKSHVRLLVGQQAATLPSDSADWKCYDLVISSFPPTLDWFRQKGIPAELNRLAFEPRVLSYLDNGQRNIDISFIGSLFPSVHSSRVELLEEICRKFDIKIWGPGVSHINSPAIQKAYMGQAWGIEMYRILNASKITLNHHGDVAPYANNLRLYEATGVGSLLVTDWKENLREMFEPGREVVAYHSAEECAELIQYYLAHDKERETIARAGQERTLKEHTYYRRMQELVNIVQKYL